ncbi:BnaCnng57020D [Brassica napus]|uniref:(rape) hypothetical protein n=1 Tax=Brassica napus TaxID=3708 RepID=A0A078JN74_BRANA|nr:putative F-box protein At3g58860 [Brassica napus]CAF2265288.1 unnamed protein product [Brassica napus]CDY67935.1 BnaCnng57020D [Brassica napus]
MDLFNKLPDPVVSHILSFLPTTKEAASTSVLAKRWRNLFAFVPNLNLDGDSKSFMDFVERVLALQGDTPIKEFSLNAKTGVDPDRVDRWICNVLRRGVTHLDLFVAFGEEYSLPHEISVSKTLVELKTGYGVDLYAWDDDMFLPNLKNLVLVSVEFGRGQFQTLLPACPVLEGLMLLNMRWRDRNEILSSPSLKKLKISVAEGCIGTFSFDTPNLDFLDYDDFVAEDYPVVNMPNIVEAGINIELTPFRVRGARDNLVKLIHGIRNVKILYLTPVTFEILSLYCKTMPVFENLTTLSVKSVMIQGWQAMPILLRSCPRLESLYIGDLLHSITDACGDVCVCLSKWIKGLSLKSCHVKKMRISGFRGTIREVHMIKHFLDYLPSLKEMEIVVEENEDTMFDIPKWLDIVGETLMHFNETSSCNVIFWMHAFLYRRLTRKWSPRG